MGQILKHPHTDEALEYARNVAKGKISACKWVKLACKRQISDLKRWKKGQSEYIWSVEKAEKVCKFVENLPHIKGEWARKGETLKLEPWQKFILTTVFGWLTPAGIRRFRTSYVEVPRKNGKSTLSAAIGLYMLVADDEQGAEIYSAATTRDQAKIIFNDAQDMARKDSELRQHFGIQVNAHNINRLSTASKFEALSAEGSTMDGLNAHGVLIDELHAHKTRLVFDVLETSSGARLQPLMWLITTAGSNRAGICYEQRSYLIKILEGIVKDDTYFGLIYTIDEGDDWKKAKSWKKANPNYGVSVYPEKIKSSCSKARELASAQNAFLTKHLNVWVNADTAWMDMEKWNSCGDEQLSIDDFETEDCWIGMDLSSKIDVTAITILFKRGGQYFAFNKYFLPRDNVHSDAHAKSAHFEGWVKDGWMTLTEGNMIDLDVIEESIREALTRFNVLAIGYDPWQASQMVGRLMNDGAPMVEIRPTVNNFSDPMKTLEALVLGGNFHHKNDPVLAWMTSNVVCHRDAKDNIYPRKEQPQNKIDGVVSLVTALNRALADPGDGGKSIYEERGITVI